MALNHARIPATLDEARQMAEYNERIIETSDSLHDIARARRMLANVVPHLERLERQAAAAAARVEAREDQDDYQVVWSGAISRQTGLQPSEVGRR